MGKHSRQTRLHAAYALAAALAFTAGAFFASGGGTPTPAANEAVLSVAEECQKALGYPARTNADKDWLRRCVHALTPPSATPTPTGSPTPSPTGSPTPSPTPTTPPPTTPAPSPTASPTPVPTTPSPTPSPSPSDWPGPTNTGPTGALTPMACPGDHVTLSTPGQVLQNVDIGDCGIDIQASGVIVRNVSAKSGWVDGYLLIVRNGASATLEDVELSGNPVMQYAVLAQETATVTITRADFHGCQDCVQGEHVSMTDSWLHDLAELAASHVDGFQCNVTCDGTVLRHNRIDLTGHDQTGAVSLFQDFGVPRNVVVEGNWLSGAGYTIYGGGGSRGTPTNIRIVDNVVDPGFYGWITAWDPSGAGNECSGNRTSAGVALVC